MRIACLLNVMLGLTLVMSSAIGQTPITAYRQDVVLIEASTESGVERGAALYAGHDSTNAFFITAAHAIYPGTGAKVRMLFYKSASWIDASVFSRYDSDRDLAVVFVPAFNLPGGIRRMSSKNPVLGTSFRMIGHPNGGEWQTWSGSVQNEVAADGKPEWFSGSGGASMGGYSGGPVLDTDGNLLGMHLREGAGYTVQLKTSAILAYLGVWGVPVDNITLEDTDMRRFRIARQMIDALRQDDGDLARANFATQAKNMMSNSQLTGAWDINMGVLGDFKRIDKQRKRSVAGSMLYVTSVRFEKGTLDVRLLFDADDQIINFWFATVSSVDSKQQEQAAMAAVQLLADGKYIEVLQYGPGLATIFHVPRHDSADVDNVAEHGWTVCSN